MFAARLRRGAIWAVRHLLAGFTMAAGAVLFAVIVGRTPHVHGRTPLSIPPVDNRPQPVALESGTASAVPDGAAAARVASPVFLIPLAVAILLVVFGGPLEQLGVRVFDGLL